MEAGCYYFHGDFDGNGAAVGKKDFIQRGGQEGGQLFGQAGGGLVGEAAEHDMAHLRQLALGGGVEAGVVVAVQRRPPGRHAVYQFAAVGQRDDAAFGRADGVNRQRVGLGGVGVPDMLLVDGEDVFGRHHGERVLSDINARLKRVSDGHIVN